MEAICASKEVLREVSKSCLAACKAANLVGFEIPKAIGLVAETWTPENNMLTAAMKLKRTDVRAQRAGGRGGGWADDGSGSGAPFLPFSRRPSSAPARLALAPAPVRCRPSPVLRAPSRVGLPRVQIVARHKAELETLYK
jgi:hypothetical protein